MLNDLNFVVPDDLEIALPCSEAGQFFVCLKGGISTRLYLSLIKQYSALSTAESNEQSLQILKDIALSIIHEDEKYKHFTSSDLEEKFNNYKLLSNLATSLYRQLNDLIADPALSLPPIDIQREKGGIEIEGDGQEIMKDIAFVMTRTANTLTDIMEMPYVTFLCLLKNLVLSEALKDPDYRNAYESWKLQEARKAGKIKKQKANLGELERFAASL